MSRQSPPPSARSWSFTAELASIFSTDCQVSRRPGLLRRPRLLLGTVIMSTLRPAYWLESVSVIKCRLAVVQHEHIDVIRPGVGLVW